MPYVFRDANNAICGVCQQRQITNQEFLVDNHPEVVAFVAASTPRPRKEITTLVQQINALSTADRQKLLVIAAAEMLNRRPKLAQAFNIDIDGEV